jgi:prolyl 4-hydroxylase
MSRFFRLILLFIYVITVLGESAEVCAASGDESCELGSSEKPADESLELELVDDTITVQNTSDSTASAIKIPKGANVEGKPIEVSFDECKDRHQQCVGWANNGECIKNPGWMTVNCPASCNNCHLRDPAVRCDRARLNISTEPIYQPGDLDDMFSHIEENFHERFGVTIISRSPWIVTFENFLSDVEIEAIINSVNGRWERSTDTGQTNQFGETGRVLSTGRTSTNAWCRHECQNNPHVRDVENRISEVIRIPTGNFENFQILQYENGQHYRPHHDSSERQKLLACGPRILTFFLYLSDVEEGGETAFPTLGISVKPKKGKALLWPSVMNADPTLIDQRTVHEARPVIRGKKYAANAWIHLYDFGIPNLWGCTGTFDMI